MVLAFFLLYIILDYNSYISSFKTLIDKAVENSYSTEEFNKSFEMIAVFAILSSKKIGCDRILLVYFIRLNIEQTFDFMKNYTNLLPLRVHTELAVRGRATVCYMSTCLLRMLQIELRSSDCNLGSNIHDLKNQKFCIYSHKIVVEDIIPEFRSMCNKLNIIIPEEFEKDIYSIGFYHNKARNIIACAGVLLRDFDGEVPQDIESLVSLPGVGRKTANVIRGNVYGIESIVVDTHVKRVSRLLGLTKEEDPEKIEYDLMKLLPKEQWILYNFQAIAHGRKICIARRPRCSECVLKDICASLPSLNRRSGSQP